MINYRAQTPGDLVYEARSLAELGYMVGLVQVCEETRSASDCYDAYIGPLIDATAGQDDPSVLFFMPSPPGQTGSEDY